MRLRTLLVAFEAEILVRRANRRRRRQLAAELACYRSAAELNDLYATLDAWPDGQTYEIRQILGDQQLRRSWTNRTV
jgi:hypothetical protein